MSESGEDKERKATPYNSGRNTPEEKQDEGNEKGGQQQEGGKVDNPIAVLTSLEEKIKDEETRLEKASLEDHYKAEEYEELKEKALEAKQVLKSCSSYLMNMADNVTSIRTSTGRMTSLIADKLKQERNEDQQTENETTPEEKEALERAVHAHQAYAQIAQLLAEVTQISAEIEEAACKMAAETAKGAEEANNLEEKAQQETEDQPDEEAIRLAEEQRKEEEARKEEEERRKKEEEEKRLEEERIAEEKRKKAEEERRAEEAKKDIRNWLPVTFKLPDQADEIGCVIRAPLENPFGADWLEVTLVDPLTSSFRLSANEEVATQALCIKSTGGQRQFKPGVWLAIPHFVTSSLYGREFIFRTSTDGQTWTAVNGREAVIPDLPDYRVAEVLLDDLETLCVVAVTSLKEDRGRFKMKSGKLVSSVDPRYNLTWPKETFTSTTEITLQLFPLDSSTLADMKALNSDLARLHACTHYLTINVKGKPNHRITLSMPGPAANRKKKSNDSNKVNEPEELDLPVTLLTKTAAGKWNCTDAFTVDEKTGAITLEMEDEKIKGVLAARIEEGRPPKADIITKMLTYSLQKYGKLIVRQKGNDMSMLHIECCRSDKAEETFTDLQKQGYSEGAFPSADFCVAEGQAIEIRFRGNICPDEEGGENRMKMVYNTQQSAHKSLYVKECSRYDQHALEVFRGHVQLWTSDYPGGTETKQVLLQECPVTLPKPPYEHPQVVRAGIAVPDKGTLTQELLEEVAGSLGDEWVDLAEKLEIKPTRLNGIKRDFNEEGLPTVIYNMLTYWYKTTPKNKDKSMLLEEALKDVNRSDLAQIIEESNKASRQLQQQKAQEERLQRTAKVLSANTPAMRQLRTWAAQLVDPEVVAELEENTNMAAYDKCLKILETWKEKKGSHAKTSVLVDILKKCKCVEAAGNVKLSLSK